MAVATRKPATRKPATRKVAAKPKAVAKPVPFEREIRVNRAEFGDAEGIDVRVWRRIKGTWIPGKGIRFADEDAEAIIEGISALIEGE
jgi:hypothetical protein